MERLRKLFARQEDPYAGADMTVALRMGSVLWVIGIVISIALWPLSPPDHPLGDSGFALAIALAASGLLYAFAMRSPRLHWSFDLLLVTGYLGLGFFAVMQWLAGGVGAPYEKLLLLPLIYVAVIHPLPRIAVFLAVTALVLGWPYVYDGWSSDAVAGSVVTFVLWSALALAGFVLMSGVRAQRLAMRLGEAQAREEARLDELTGIGNRRAFEEAIDNEIARSQRLKGPLSVAMADIDSFKRINDEWGHLEGDQCLRRVSDAIVSELRAPDRCFRWGGDEFAILLPGTNAEGAQQFVERLQNKVLAACRRPDNEPIHVRVGTAELRDGMSRQDLLAAADLALLTSKTTG